MAWIIELHLQLAEQHAPKTTEQGERQANYSSHNCIE